MQAWAQVSDVAALKSIPAQLTDEILCLDQNYHLTTNFPTDRISDLHQINFFGSWQWEKGWTNAKKQTALNYTSLVLKRTDTFLET